MGNVYTSLTRIYAAYNITNPQVYDLAMWSFAGVVFLNTSEMLVYRTSRFKEAAWAIGNASSAFLWMYLQRDWYLQ